MPDDIVPNTEEELRRQEQDRENMIPCFAASVSTPLILFASAYALALSAFIKYRDWETDRKSVV